MKYIYVISKDGQKITGLWTDMLSELGQAQVTRASSVEFDEDVQGWVVTFYIGHLKDACLPETFPTRSEALRREVATINDFLSERRIKEYGGKEKEGRSEIHCRTA